jgi:hypothetical protein
MQLSVDISLDNLLLLISKMDVNQIEEVKNKIVEQKLYFQTFQKDDIENIVDDFRKEEYSNDFLLDLEAGLRSHAKSMPEEINRIMTDVISDYLLTPSPDADENLLKEGKSKEKIYLVGNIMIDSIIQYKDKAEESKILDEIGVSKKDYALITLHRPSIVDNKECLITILNAFEEINKDVKLILF